MNKLIILYMLQFSDLGGQSPDVLVPLHAFDTLEECWADLERRHPEGEGETVFACLPARG